MTQAEYAAFETAVGECLARHDIHDFHPKSDTSRTEFSWRACECCGSKLGGSRTLCVGLRRGTNDDVEITACDDCVVYVAYGYLDGVEDGAR